MSVEVQTQKKGINYSNDRHGKGFYHKQTTTNKIIATKRHANSAL